MADKYGELYGNSPQTLLQDARHLAMTGRYQEALQLYLWFHEHALEYDDTLSSVRLAPAIYDWVKLGEEYPPALNELIIIRDRKTQAIINGDQSLSTFTDVAAINRALNQHIETVTLFKYICQFGSEFAIRCYPRAEESLVAAGEYQLCSMYLLNPIETFQIIAEARRTSLNLAAGLNDQHMQQLVFNIEHSFVKAVNGLLRILVSVERTEEAERLRAMALSESTSDIVQAGLR